METKPSKKNFPASVNDNEFLNKYTHDSQSQIFSKIAHKITKKISFGKSAAVSQNKKMSSQKRKIDNLELPDSGPFERSSTPMSGYSSSEEEYGPSANQPLIYNDAVSIQLHQPRTDMATGG
jgi:hypothetical protein